MYEELYNAWRVEIEGGELGNLPGDFYERAAKYIRSIKEENRMLDKKSVKLMLLEREQGNAGRLLEELVSIRYRKIVKRIATGQKIPSDSLAFEERKLCDGVTPSADAFNRFAKALLHGQSVTVDPNAVEHKRVTLRFVKPVPSIIGADMKTYGPFMVEDVASLPAENAKILVRQHLAELVEVA